MPVGLNKDMGTYETLHEFIHRVRKKFYIFLAANFAKC